MKKIISLSPTKSDFGPLLFSGNLDLGLQKASELGYDGVELSLRDSTEIDFTWLQARLSVLHLKVYGIATGQTYYNDGFGLFSEEPVKREQAVQRMKGHIDLAAKLGASVIIGGIRGKIEANKNCKTIFAKGREAVREIAQAGLEKKVTLVIEPINRYETNIFNTVAQGIELIQELGFENLKMLADTFHMNLEEVSISETLRQAGKYLGYVHFADSNRLAPGWGNLDFGSTYQTLKEIGYAGPVGIEVLPKPGDMEAARQGIEFLNNLI